MSRITLFLMGLVMLSGCGESAGPGRAGGPAQTTGGVITVGEDDVAALVTGNNRFALDLYGQLGDEPGNLFFSPYSVSAALAMTYAGALGETADEMAQALRMTLVADRVHAAFGMVQQRLNGAGEDRAYTLSIANRLWGQAGEDFVPEFLDLTREHYGSELATVDFRGETERAREAINAWVEQQTHEKIKELIKPGILDAMTRLVLTNAIYFKSEWAEQFSEHATYDAAFHLNDDDDVTVPMMRQRGPYQYATYDDLAVLEIPYKGGELSMVILLPDQIEGLAALEQRLTHENVERWCAGVVEQEVKVLLPKFKISAQFGLRDALESLGMKRAFDAMRADFTGMSDKGDLFISAVVHEAFVEVDETGTEAAAATAVVLEKAIALPPPAVGFRADHPFVFMIRHNQTGAILFQGRLANPAE
ncbi:MAG: serpin family protein [Planctomycetaceae bacterium]|nr:serpin family protein [Planctomycetaceae bacterium]